MASGQVHIRARWPRGEVPASAASALVAMAEARPTLGLQAAPEVCRWVAHRLGAGAGPGTTTCPPPAPCPCPSSDPRAHRRKDHLQAAPAALRAEGLPDRRSRAPSAGPPAAAVGGRGHNPEDERSLTAVPAAAAAVQTLPAACAAAAASATIGQRPSWIPADPGLQEEQDRALCFLGM
mmetsp:Transcript_30461/g.78730  ORF Transcript_30461/g.78730 Transcript_30461/m.78730 type:complete len:179 (-) Transcript_30461:938-1474(-)